MRKKRKMTNEDLRVELGHFKWLNELDFEDVEEAIERSLDERVVKTRTVTSNKRYPDGYIYQEVLLYIVLENFTEFLFYRAARHYGKEGCKEHNAIVNAKLKRIRKFVKGKLLKELIK